MREKREERREKRSQIKAGRTHQFNSQQSMSAPGAFRIAAFLQSGRPQKDCRHGSETETETHRDRDRYRERPRQRLTRADVNALSVAKPVAAPIAVDVTMAVPVISNSQCHSCGHTHVKAIGNMYVALAQSEAR